MASYTCGPLEHMPLRQRALIAAARVRLAQAPLPDSRSK
jgi:hypothetical protein